MRIRAGKKTAAALSPRHLLLIACVAAYFSLFKQVYWVFKPFNYYGTIISGSYFMLVGVATLLLAAFFILARWLLQHLAGEGRARHVVDGMVLWALCFIPAKLAVDTLVERWFVPPSVKAALLCPWVEPIYFIVLPALLITWLPYLVRRVTIAVYSILSPLLIIFLVYAVNHTFVTNRRFTMEPPPALTATEGTPPSGRKVLLFIFDEWSYGRTFDETGQPRVPMPALDQLRARGTLYHQAFSPGPETQVSVPRFLFQPDRAVMDFDYDTLRSKVQAHASIDGRSVFDLAGPDWFKGVVGFWLDYASLLGNRIDLQVSYPLKLAIGPLYESLGHLLLSQREWARAIGVNRWNARWVPKVSCAQTALREPAFAMIQSLPEHAIIFFHMGLPHLPSKDVWGMRIPSLKYADDTSVEGYTGNLARLDTMLGEFYDVMQKTGVLDDALVVMTSDHAWRYDPATPGYDAKAQDPDPRSIFKHVPLLILVPGAQGGRDVWQTVETANIHQLVSDYVAGKAVEELTWPEEIK